MLQAKSLSISQEQQSTSGTMRPVSNCDCDPPKAFTRIQYYHEKIHVSDDSIHALLLRRIRFGKECPIQAMDKASQESAYKEFREINSLPVLQQRSD